MTESEKELIRIFREADDPTKAWEVMADILTRCVADIFGSLLGHILDNDPKLHCTKSCENHHKTI